MHDWVDHTWYHWPYRWRVGDLETGLGDPQALPPHEPFHITVVDIYDPNDPNQSRRRRVVEMNPAGIVLSDKTWNRTQDPNGDIVEVLGFAEQRFYDGSGRLVMLGSKGWGCAPNQVDPSADPENQGLVRVFTYETPADPNKAGELKAVGIKPGTGNLYRDPNTGNLPYYLDGVRWIEAYQHHPDRPKLVTAEIKFPTPVLDCNSMTEDWTTYTYTFKDPNNPNSGVKTKDVRRPASARAPNGPGYSPIERYVYNARGNLQWVGVGSQDASNSVSEFYITYTAYNNYGQPTLNIIDTVPGEPNQPVFPSEWERCSETDPLRLRTEWTYDPTYGLVKTVYPNRREAHIVYQADPCSSTGLYVWEYKDVVPDPNTGTCRLLSPLKVTHLLSGQAVLIQEVKLDTTDYPPIGMDEYDQSDVISETTPTYSMSGQVTGMARSAGGSSLSASVAYDSGGQVSREVGPDGTITRYTYDSLARLARTFRGTRDGHFVWGTAPQGDPNENMVLIEKRYYGEGLHDADELTMVRHYRDEPNNQYLEWSDGSGWVGGNPTEDIIGWPTVYQYDWRMRPVWQTEGNPDGSALRHTLTWYDNLDRPVIVADFGPVANVAGLDPNGLLPAWPSDPSQVTGLAESLLLTTPRPISVAENVYNARGLVEEARQWRLVGETPQYTATRTYYDYGDRPVEVHAPNAPVQKYVYDAKGRQVLSQTVANNIVVTDTQTVYDDNDRAIETIHTEYDANGANGIASYTYTWYDEAGRVLATANYGTNATTYSMGGVKPSHNLDEWPLVGADSSLVTQYEYDEAGRQSAVFHPDGTITRSLYDGLGRLRLTTENAGDRDNDGTIRRTAYQYDDKGRLIGMAAVLPDYPAVTLDNLDGVFGNDPNNVQVTRFAYDAVVYPGTWNAPIGGSGSTGYELTWEAQSGNNGWISQVTYPPTAADPCGQTLAFSYYSDGSVAQRVDSRGVEFSHQYDGQGRRTYTWIDDSLYFAESNGQPWWEPPNRIHQVHYDYDEEGRLELVTAYGWDTGEEIARNAFEYDDWGNLTRERQSHLGRADADDWPTVTYAWDFADYASGNYNRLASIQYPAFGSLIRLGYTTDSVSSALSRVTSISDGNTPLALYGYIGTSRRVSTLLDAVAVQSFSSAGGYPGLDQFGRVIDLTYAWATSPTQTIQEYQYGYDLAGNRTYARVTQANVDGTDHVNDRSYLYAYDALSRLVGAHLGRLTPDNSAIEVADPNVPLRRQLGWSLDNLGNWTGSPPSTPGLFRDDYVDGTTPAARTLDVSHAVNPANQLQSVETIENGGDPNTQPVIHDRAGNLVWDGQLFYQYDGFNRLVQVNEAGDPNLPGLFDADGRLAYYPLEGPTPLGPTLASFAYDGLGRLIRTDRCERARDPNDPNAPRRTQSEEYYYDGVRRIFEFEITDPNTPSSVTASREYVYGPGYVDEVVCQIAERTGVPPAIYYYLQDGNYNVTAVLGPPDPNATTGPGASPVVLWQYTYEPYGTVVFADSYDGGVGVPPAVLPVNRLGHQGLFFERFCLDPNDSITAPALMPDDPETDRKVVGLYNNRNRWYSPELGRFVQKDMNKTALPIITALAVNGDAIDILFGAFGPSGHFGDGMNLYQYAGSNPVNWTDPTGLDDFEGEDPFADPFQEVDDIIMRMGGERVAAMHHAMSMIGKMAQTAGTLAVQSLLAAMFPPYGVYLSVKGAATAIEDMMFNGISWSNSALLGLSVVGIRAGAQASIQQAEWALGKLASGMRAGYRAVGNRYAQAGMSRSGFAGADRPGRVKANLSWGICFTEGTLVATGEGEYSPIETIQVGQRVLTTDGMRDADGFPDVFPPDASAPFFGDEDSVTAVAPATWRLIELAMPNPYGSDDTIAIRTLRPLSWLHETSCEPGRTMRFALPEMGLAGSATVRSIRPCPAPEPGPGRVVLTTVTHLNSFVLRIWLNGLTEPIEPTNTHRLYSEESCDWVLAGSLSVGEHLRTMRGSTEIVQIESKPGTHRVYNLEVETWHCYYVSTNGVLSHNAGWCGAGGGYQALKDFVKAWANSPLQKSLDRLS